MTVIEITLRMSEEDFQRLCTNGGTVTKRPGEASKRWPGPDVDGRRFRADRYAYYHTLHDWSAVMLARAFLDTRGEDYQIICDEALDLEVFPDPWFIFTNYATPHERQWVAASN